MTLSTSGFCVIAFIILIYISSTSRCSAISSNYTTFSTRYDVMSLQEEWVRDSSSSSFEAPLSKTLTDIFEQSKISRGEKNFRKSLTTCEELDDGNTWRDISSLAECVDAHVYIANVDPKSIKDHDQENPRYAPCGCTLHVWGHVDWWGLPEQGCSTTAQCNWFRGDDRDQCYCARIDPVEWDKCLKSDLDCQRERAYKCVRNVIKDLSSDGCQRDGSNSDCFVSDERLDECGNLWLYDYVADGLKTDEDLRDEAFEAITLYRDVYGAVFDASRPSLPAWPKSCSGYIFFTGVEVWEPDLEWTCSGCNCKHVRDQALYFDGVSTDGFNGICYNKVTETSKLCISSDDCIAGLCGAQGGDYVYEALRKIDYFGVEIHHLFFSIQQAFFDLILNPDSIDSYPAWIDKYGKGWEDEARHFPGLANSDISLNSEDVIVDITLGTPWGLPVAYAEDPLVVPTGIYVPPSTITTVTVPNVSAISDSARILIGSHIYHPGNTGGNRPGGLRRFDRVTYDMALQPGKEMVLFNPFGGNIYIEIQPGANVGPINLTFDNVARSPLFQLTRDMTTSCGAWDAVAGDNASPWTDIITDETFLNMPTEPFLSMDCNSVKELAETWQKRFGGVSTMMGYRSFRSKWVLYLQEDVRSRFGVGGIGEPMVNGGINMYRNPIVNLSNWKLTDVLNDLVYHELGHMQGMPKFPGESESIVHLPYTYASHHAGNTLDHAFTESTGPGGLKDALISWIVTEEFQTGLPMNIESTPNNQIRYQQRGHAKYIDLVRIFGWNNLIAYFRAHQLLYESFKVHANPDYSIIEQEDQYYDTNWPWKKILMVMAEASSLEAVDWERLTKFFDGSYNNASDNMSVHTDVNIVVLSLAMGSNLLSYLEFWGVNGIHTNGKTKINDIVGSLPTSTICSLYQDYESYIPQNQRDLSEHIERLWPAYIESIDPNTHVINWTDDVWYRDERYGPGYYAQHSIFDDAYSDGIKDAEKRLASATNIACYGYTTSPVSSPAEPTLSPVLSPTLSPVLSPTQTTLSPVSDENGYTTATETCETSMPANAWQDITSKEECLAAHVALFQSTPNKVNDYTGDIASYYNAPCGCTYHAPFNQITFWGVEGSGCSTTNKCLNFRDDNNYDVYCYCKQVTNEDTTSPSSSPIQPTVSPVSSPECTKNRDCNDDNKCTKNKCKKKTGQCSNPMIKNKCCKINSDCTFKFKKKNEKCMAMKCVKTKGLCKKKGKAVNCASKKDCEDGKCVS